MMTNSPLGATAERSWVSFATLGTDLELRASRTEDADSKTLPIDGRLDRVGDHFVGFPFGSALRDDVEDGDFDGPGFPDFEGLAQESHGISPPADLRIALAPTILHFR